MCSSKVETNNQQLMESLFKQIKEETGYHIINKKYCDMYLVYRGAENSICQFSIEEIPGFLFGCWHVSRVDMACFEDMDKRSQLILFTQYERDIDKFMPSRSAFVTGLQTDNDESGNMHWKIDEFIAKLNFMENHPVKAYYYANNHIEHIWQEASFFTCLKEYISDGVSYYINTAVTHLKHDIQKYQLVHFCKKLKNINALAIERSNEWSPRFSLVVRRKDYCTIEQFNKAYGLIEHFIKKHSNWVAVYAEDVDMSCGLNSKDREEDKMLCLKFYKYVAANTSKDNNTIILYNNISQQDIIDNTSSK